MKSDPTFPTQRPADFDSCQDEYPPTTFESGRLLEFRAIPRSGGEKLHIHHRLAELAGKLCRGQVLANHQALQVPFTNQCERMITEEISALPDLALPVPVRIFRAILQLDSRAINPHRMLPSIVPKLQVIWRDLIKQARLDPLTRSAFLEVSLGFIHQMRTSSLLSFVCSSSV